MTNYSDRATALPVEDTEFLWALILDMAKTVDRLAGQTEPDTHEVK